MRLNRYSTLGVTFQQPLDQQTLTTIPISSESSDDRAKKFKELYFKNEKLRRQLKSLNQRLNERLQKLKLPSSRRCANKCYIGVFQRRNCVRCRMRTSKRRCVGSRFNPYVRGRTQPKTVTGPFDVMCRLRQLENDVAYKDMEIEQVQQQLKSMRMVTKLQNRTIQGEVDTMVYKIDGVQAEIKSLKQKQKEMQVKTRNRDQEYKKQQAYLVALKQKSRLPDAVEEEEPLATNITDMEFRIVREEINKYRHSNEEIMKKIDYSRVCIKHLGKERSEMQRRSGEQEQISRNLVLKIESYNRLLRDMEKKNKQYSYGIEIDYEELSSFHPNQSLYSSITPGKVENSSKLVVDSNNSNSNKLIDNNKMVVDSNKIVDSRLGVNKLIVENTLEEREWQGDCRKVSVGYMRPEDTQFQVSGQVLGMKVFMTDEQIICGLVPILKRGEGEIIGSEGAVEMQWQVKNQDRISKVMGSFSQQGYLGQISFVTTQGFVGRFGLPHSDPFLFKVQSNEYISGLFGGIRQMGKDSRISQIGFWISKRV